MLISFLLGCLIGGLSGYFGGVVDEIIQRFIDLMIQHPHAAAVDHPVGGHPHRLECGSHLPGHHVVLSLFGWPGLARVVRGKLLSLRDLDFVTAAKIGGSSDLNTILTHLLPNFASYLIVSVTLAIPGMILGETALSSSASGCRIRA